MSKGILMTAIREKCMDCSCDSTEEIRLCPDTKCALYPFRMGKNPFSKSKGNTTALLACKKEYKENPASNQSN